MYRTIFTKGSQQVHEILSQNSPQHVLIVPIDWAKKKHVAKICDATAYYLPHRPITLHNTTKGVEYLIGRIKKSCNQKRIKRTLGA